MAARINVKLLLIVIIVLGTLGATLGAIYIINSRTDATRFITAGDELLQSGETRRAIIQYRRAIGRDRMSIEYIERLRSAILTVEPETETEAFDYFMEYVATFQHVVTHYPADAQGHLDYLNLVYSAAMEQLGNAFWDLLETGGRAMLDRITVDDPRRDEAMFFVAAGVLAPSRVMVLPAETVSAAYAMMDEYLTKHPDDQRAFAAIVDARLAEADRRRLDNRIAATESLDHARRVLKTAIERDLAGPWAGSALPRFDIVERQMGVQPLTFSRDVIDETIRSAFRAVRTTGLDEVSVPLMLRVLLNVEERRGEVDMPDPLEAVDEFLQRQPDSSRLMGLRTQLLMSRGEFTEAGRMARALYDKPAGRAGMESLRQWQLRRFAAAVLFDVAVVDWERAASQLVRGEDARDEIAAIGDALERLRQVTTLPDEDPQFQYAHARHLFAQGDFPRAAVIFDRLVREGRIVNPQILVYSAVTLERQGQLGLALQRIEGALSTYPSNPVLLRTKLRIAEGLSNDDMIAATAAQLLVVEPQSEAALRAQQRLAERGVGVDAQGSMLAYFEEVTEMIRAERYDEAAASLEQGIARSPDDLRLYRALAEVRFAAGDRPGARRAVERALEVAPDNRFFLSLREVAEIQDPVESVTRWWATFEDDPRDRLFSELRETMARRSRLLQSAERSEQSGDAAAAAEQRELARRFRERESALLSEAVRAYPSDRTTLDLRLDRAIAAEDWREAESVLVEARRVDADLAGGFVFEGRIRMARGDFEAAVRALREAAGRVSHSAEVHYALGGALIAVGNVTDAVRAFEQSYDINPTDERVIRLLADAYVQIENLPRATELVRVLAQRSPSDVGMRERWYALEAEIGNLDRVLLERRRLIREKPDDLRNVVGLVHFLERRVPERRTMLDSAGEPRQSVARWQLLSPARQQDEINAERGRWRQEVDRILAAARPAAIDSPNMLLWSILSADVELGRGRSEQGEALLRQLAQALEGEGRLIAMLAVADLQRRRGRIEDALQTYRGLESSEFGERAEVLWHTANTYLNIGRPLDAIPYVERLVTGDPDARLRIWNVSTQNTVIQVMELPLRDVELSIVEQLRRADRLAEARERFDRVSRLGEPTLVSRSLEIELLIAEADAAWSRGDDAAATAAEATIAQRADEFAATFPVNDTPHLVRANRALQSYRRTRDDTKLQEAARRLDTAEQYAPGSASVLRLRYAVLSEGGQRQQAEGILRNHLDTRPADEVVRRLLIEHHVRERAYPRAIAVAQEEVTRIGENARAVPWYAVVADLHVRAGNHLAAAEAYSAAFRLDPSARLLSRLCTQLLSRADVSARDYQRVQDELRNHPAFLNEDPSLRLVLARAMLGQRRAQEANAQIRESYQQRSRRVQEGVSEPVTLVTWVLDLRQAMSGETLQRVEDLVRELTGGAPGVWEQIGLGRMWVQSGPDGASRGLELLRGAFDALPAGDERMRVFLLMELGNAALQAKRYADAAGFYEQLLELQPNQGVALNNLAYVVAEHLGRPADALPLAMQAVTLMPTSWSALDTAARAQFLLGRHEESMRLLQRSIMILEHPTNLAHLAEVHLVQGNLEAARAQIERAAGAMALLGEPNDDDRARIDRIRTEIAAKSGAS